MGATLRSKIRTLPSSIVNRIAAGEVIERPAYAIKELVENAIDAGASSIKIVLEDAGLKKLIVTDDGHGMSKDDLILSFQKNTTSKIRDEADLSRIRTMGFRGEALASIAAVSHLTIKTKMDEDDTGWMVELHPDDDQVELSVAGVPNGTSVVVDHLFQPVPVRRKFLKTNRTELRHIIDILTNVALAYPELGVFVTHNRKVMFDLPRNQSLEDRIRTLLGSHVFDHLIPVSLESDYFSIHGYISKPQLAGRATNKQHLFVNNRSVSHPLISSTVRDLYGSLLEPGLNPVFVLFIGLPHEMVDVNIHPRKEEVNFQDNHYVARLLEKAIQDSLTRLDLTFRQLHSPDKPDYFSYQDRKTEASTHYVLREEVEPWDARNELRIRDKNDILQVHNLYIIAQTDNGLIMVDQHAAHERILYEQFSKVFKEKAGNCQSIPLEESLIIDFSVSDRVVFEEHADYFRSMGFDIDPFEHGMFKINAIPSFFDGKDIVKLIREVVDDLASGKTPKEIDTKSKKTLAYLACRSAIKAGDVLSPDECKELLMKLEQTDSQYTCPHGRPVKIEISKKELGKMFRR